MTAAWRTHPNASGPAGLLLSVHDHFRAASARLQTIDPSLARRLFAPLAEMLHHHHHAEEVSLFPLVERRSGTAPVALVGEHEALTAAIAAVEEDATRATLAHFHDVLVTHLDREEALVVPILLGMTPAEAWAEVQRT